MDPMQARYEINDGSIDPRLLGYTGDWAEEQIDTPGSQECGYDIEELDRMDLDTTFPTDVSDVITDVDAAFSSHVELPKRYCSPETIIPATPYHTERANHTLYTPPASRSSHRLNPQALPSTPWDPQSQHLYGTLPQPYVQQQTNPGAQSRPMPESTARGCPTPSSSASAQWATNVDPVASIPSRPRGLTLRRDAFDEMQRHTPDTPNINTWTQANRNNLDFGPLITLSPQPPAQHSRPGSSAQSVTTFACPFDTCLKSFRTKQDLDHHRRYHDGCRKHICTLCEKDFLFRKDLERHNKKHTEERHLLCNIIGCPFQRGFKRRDHYDRHMRNQHGVARPASSRHTSNAET